MVRGIVVRLIVFLAVPISFFSPFNGALWYLWYSHFRPNDFIWPQYAFKSGALLIAIATLAGYVLFELPHSPPRWRGLVIVTLFWLWIGVATIFANDRTLAFWKFSQYTNILVMTFLIAAMANSGARIRAMITVAGVSVGLLGLRATAEFLLTGGQFRVLGVGGVELEANEFALALNMAVAILGGLSFVETRRWLRISFRVLALCCVVAVVGTFSRSGFLGLSIALFLLAWYSNRRKLSLSALALVFILLLPFAPKKALERYESIPTAAELDPSAIARIQTWETGIRMVKAHPIIGVGPSNFQSQYSHYLVEKYLSAANYHPRAPHNAYVALAAESGIPSMLLFVSFIGATAVNMWRLRRRTKNIPGMRELSYYCLTIQITLMVYLIPNFFISRQNEDLMYHLVGISSGLAVVVKARLAEPETELAGTEIGEGDVSRLV
jgi:putative inorganic carbon (HCO3(-)) transporter